VTGSTATRWELTRLDVEVGLAQLPPSADVPRWALEHQAEVPLWMVLRNPDELSVICDWQGVPGSVHSVGPLTVFSIDGPLDHTLTGVLAGLLQPLAAAGVSIRAESSYDTDWILVPSPQADAATEISQSAGHLVEYAGDPS